MFSYHSAILRYIIADYKILIINRRWVLYANVQCFFVYLGVLRFITFNIGRMLNHLLSQSLMITSLHDSAMTILLCHLINY